MNCSTRNPSIRQRLTEADLLNSLRRTH
ncbi:hypothetical protein KAU25_05160 [Candidatus Bathyarchaeota archaeon]|nr:hypothetical protein [Candidatus Bathyarchaeota archaeon]